MWQQTLHQGLPIEGNSTRAGPMKYWRVQAGQTFSVFCIKISSCLLSPIQRLGGSGRRAWDTLRPTASDFVGGILLVYESEKPRPVHTKE